MNVKSVALISLCVASVLGATGAGLFTRTAGMTPPQTVRISGGMEEYRPAGEFRLGTLIADAPLVAYQAHAFDIMAYHVTEADYTRCVDDRACLAAPSGNRADRAQTNVNLADAKAYAAWLSERTGDNWRLPTDAEWLRAAAERGFDDAFAAEANGLDPSRRWIALYRREAQLRGEADSGHHPLGHFGVNALGVHDIAGNIWEWTETCFRNGTLSADGSAILSRTDHCGVRAVQGKHRGYVTDFIRDARSGGCAAGVPPDYLGMRLVRSAQAPQDP